MTYYSQTLRSPKHDPEFDVLQGTFVPTCGCPTSEDIKVIEIKRIIITVVQQARAGSHSRSLILADLASRVWLISRSWNQRHALRCGALKCRPLLPAHFGCCSGDSKVYVCCCESLHEFIFQDSSAHVLANIYSTVEPHSLDSRP
jgi:hypothetical protein